MKVLVVNRQEVQRSLSMRECVEAMADVLMKLGRGHALNPLRSLMWLPDKTGLIGMMPACLEDVAVMGVKAISVFPANPKTGHDTHQGAVLLFETKNGRLLAMLDAGMITALRTAAVSGAATRLLARRDAKSLALLGSGMQATTHLEAMCIVREIKRVRVWSRNLDHARDFAERETACRSLAIEPVETAAQAVDGADIICTATSATEPVLKGDWIAPGSHINAVGACVPSARELDTAAVARSRLFVDCLESTRNEAGDFLLPRREGAIGDDHILGELGDLLLGRIQGRNSPEEVTLFKSLGLAVEDIAAAHHLYRKLSKQNDGTWIEFN